MDRRGPAPRRRARLDRPRRPRAGGGDRREGDRGRRRRGAAGRAARLEGLGRDAGAGARRDPGARRAVAARAAPGGRGAGRARVREAVARGRRRRLRGDRLPRVLRPRRAGHRPGRAAAAGPGREEHALLRPARHRRGDLAVELPARDPARDGQRGPGHGQLGRAQAGRAVAGLRADDLPCPARGGRAARRGVAAARRGRRRRRARQGPARAHDRLHGLGRGRAGDRARIRADAPRPEPPQARDRRDGRQELRDRRLRRRPRRGRARRS